jgi:surface polysaccharide O-acyltransferase-like enzyme
VLFHFLRNIPGRIQAILTTLGQSSLLIYTVHIVIVYGSAATAGLYQAVGQTQPLSIAVTAGVVVLAAMFLLAGSWEYIRSNHKTISRFVQAGVTVAVVSLFLLRPC